MTEAVSPKMYGGVQEGVYEVDVVANIVKAILGAGGPAGAAGVIHDAISDVKRNHRYDPAYVLDVIAEGCRQAERGGA